METLKNSSLITSQPFIHISREESFQEGGDGDRESIIGCLQLLAWFLQQGEKDRSPVKTENTYCTKHDRPFLKRILRLV